MEACTIQKKKNAVKKGKLKKTIKNIICRPDPLAWPVLKEDQENAVVLELKKHQVEIPEFKKPHWNELKLIPKDKRPKPPPIKKATGFLFGRSECMDSLERGDCAAVILESDINPRIIFQSLIEACENSNVPVVCLKNMRKHSLAIFGIPTSSLGIKHKSVPELVNIIVETTKHNKNTVKKSFTDNKQDIINYDVEFKDSEKQLPVESEKSTAVCPYLYRDSKKVRIFMPPASDKSVKKTLNKFVGQDFIEFSDKLVGSESNQTFKNMMLKRISNNPNRVNAKLRKSQKKNSEVKEQT